MSALLSLNDAKARLAVMLAKAKVAEATTSHPHLKGMAAAEVNVLTRALEILDQVQPETSVAAAAGDYAHAATPEAP